MQLMYIQLVDFPVHIYFFWLTVLVQLDPWAAADEIVKNMIQGGVLIANSLLKFLINYIST